MRTLIVWMTFLHNSICHAIHAHISYKKMDHMECSNVGPNMFFSLEHELYIYIDEVLAYVENKEHLKYSTNSKLH